MPKVGVRHIDLYKLYQRVTSEGGYDLCSDTKAKPLMWRGLAEEFVGKNVYTAAQAFQIKNVYYKNLCAYEIKHHFGKEPPPKEILEDVTAKGGNVMGRTLENFVRPVTRELELADASDASPEQKTPKEEKMDTTEDPGSATGRSTRGLRHQPPQRVLFQPDVSSSRQSRSQLQTQGSQPSPSPGSGATGHSGVNGIVNASSLTNGASSTLASYEPSHAVPLTLKPVTTPANNPDFYRNERKRKLEANAGPLARKYRNIMLPGTGFIGPNIYIRAQLALQSGISEEEQYALHHLVKISHERGERYRFDQFPALADALLKKVIQVAGLFYDVEWDISYDDDSELPDEALNGLTGTPDILEKLKSRIPLATDDSTLEPRFLSQLNRITEAGLIIRNMSLQDENAAYLSRLPLTRDVIAVVLNLPAHPGIVELRHYILDIAEQVLKEVDIGPQDAIYQGLVATAMGDDRGAIASSFRTISRIAMNNPAPKRLEEIPTALLHRARDFLLFEDEELRCACLDFLMQYTSFSDNVEILLRNVDSSAFAKHLSRLLFASAKEVREYRANSRTEPELGVTSVPRLSKILTENLLKLDEPERSSEWLRMCFLADATGEMTQISLWQAYQGTFAPYNATHPHMIAGDFIKNISTTFPGASAQVAGANKYVIKGIRPRKVPIDTGVMAGSKGSDKGKELCRCRWKSTITIDGSRDPTTGQTSAPTTRETECTEWFRNSQEMLEHILFQHLAVPKKVLPPAEDADQMDLDVKPVDSTNVPNGLTNGASAIPLKAGPDFATADKTVYKCRWGECKRTSSDYANDSNVSRTKLFARHIATHLPTNDNPSRLRHNLRPDAPSKPLVGETLKIQVLEDESGEAAGVPIRAGLILRNIARFMPKSLPGRNGVSKKEERPGELMAEIFGDEVKERLFFAMSHSKALRDVVGQILRAVKQADGGPLQV